MLILVIFLWGSWTFVPPSTLPLPLHKIIYIFFIVTNSTRIGPYYTNCRAGLVKKRLECRTLLRGPGLTLGGGRRCTRREYAIPKGRLSPGAFLTNFKKSFRKLVKKKKNCFSTDAFNSYFDDCIKIQLFKHYLTTRNVKFNGNTTIIQCQIVVFNLATFTTIFETVSPFFTAQ